MPIQVKNSLAPIPARRNDTHQPQTADSSNLGVLEYLQQCRDQKRPIAVITGAPGSGKSMLLRRFLHYNAEGPVAYAKNATESPHAFLESILLQFGLETFDSTLSELRNLTMVFVRHQASKGSRTIIIVEEAQNYGPRVLALIRMFSKLEFSGQSALLFILTGSRHLNDLLGAPAGTERCDLDALNALPLMPNKASDRNHGRLEVMLGDKLLSEHAIDRQQILIGRKQQNDICLNGRFVSRHHAVLISQPIGVFVVDLKSTNGLCVNAERVSRRALANGDIISIGDYRLKFVDCRVEKATAATDDAPDDLSQTVAMLRPPAAQLNGLQQK
jgi:type II secretory pathway predicted ATPase ExeA